MIHNLLPGDHSPVVLWGMCILLVYVCSRNAQECNHLGRHFVTCLKGDSTLGPALVLLDVVAERFTHVQWEPCAHPGRLIAGLLMTAKRWKQLLFISRRMDAKYLADFFFC